MVKGRMRYWSYINNQEVQNHYFKATHLWHLDICELSVLLTIPDLELLKEGFDKKIISLSPLPLED